MGTYVNIGNEAFASIRNGEYTDKSGLIDVVNSTLFTEHRFTCVTRSRRFGKSMAAKILCAYLSYDREREECYIPNKEVGREMINAVNANKWTVVSNARFL